ncbi:MAG: STAS domain-containing protein [Nitrospirae bacterium]|nr:STAS domain-containing protein [Nitrospirota bacterium]
MSDFQLSKSGELRISGDVTILNAAEVKDAVLGALKNSKNVTIDIKGIEGVDLSFLQIYFAARHSAEASKKGLSLINPPEGFLSLIEDAGFDRYFNFPKSEAANG